MDDNINNDIDDKTGDVENVVKSDYNEETLEDVVDGNVIKAKDTEKWSESVELRKCGYGGGSWGKFWNWSITKLGINELFRAKTQLIFVVFCDIHLTNFQDCPTL